MKKISRSIIASFGYVLCLPLIYYAHVNYFRVNVVFYSAIVDAILATFVCGLILWRAKYFSIFNGFEKSLLVLIWMISGYAAAISGPTVIDRSLSFYILEKLQQRGGGIRQQNLSEVFINEYMPEHRLLDVRLTEQLESGTIVIEDGCVKLTKTGARVASFSRYFRKNWLPKQRLLLGEYSAELTDPFNSSSERFDYICGELIRTNEVGNPQ